MLIFLLLIVNATQISGLNLNQIKLIKNDNNKNSKLSFNVNYNITIPDDYPTIQQGVEKANPGDKILVRAGIYKENIIINKERLLLQGENKYNTIIFGFNTKKDGFLINAKGVTIQGFTITNYKSDEKLFSQQAGIKIFSSNATIKENIIMDNEFGVEVYCQAYNLTIEDNEFIDDGLFLGNYLNSKNYSILTIDDFTHNINNNTVNGRPLYYNINKNDFKVPTEAGQIILANCSNVTISDMFLSRNDFPIILAYCNNCVLENLTITQASGETLLFRCNNNTIQNNRISNIFKGICLEIESSNNIIRYNEFTNNSVGISSFNSANNNSIYQNKVYNNKYYGIEIVSYHGGKQQDNIIKQNELYNNKFGIVLRGKSINNIIQNNTITKSNIGILLENLSNENIIENNNFISNIIPSVFNGCTKNYYNNNYWNRPRFLPKIIKGLKPFGNLRIPYINLDKHPAKALNKI